MRGLDAMSLGDDDRIRTNPTTPVTVRDYVAAEKPRSLASIQGQPARTQTATHSRPRRLSPRLRA